MRRMTVTLTREDLMCIKASLEWRANFEKRAGNESKSVQCNQLSDLMDDIWIDGEPDDENELTAD